jgi:hypothetical protein
LSKGALSSAYPLQSSDFSNSCASVVPARYREFDAGIRRHDDKRIFIYAALGSVIACSPCWLKQYGINIVCLGYVLFSETLVSLIRN